MLKRLSRPDVQFEMTLSQHPESEQSSPDRTCLAYQYANCTDFSHCASCDPLEQWLRVATSARLNF